MMSSGPLAKEWKVVFRRAGATTMRASPWVWLAVLTPLLFGGSWTLRNVATLTLVALATLPLVFLVAVAVQILPRSWYR